ncbi:MAG TPA: FCD domain-containing protein [Casimicrobiaceae bacterium]
MLASLKRVDRALGLADQAYQNLRELIRAAQLPAGQPLQETALALQLGVSRTPVREALARLAHDGLVVSDGRSFIVPSLTDADIDEIYEVRSLLEPAALRRVAAKTRDPKVRAPIKAALEASIAAHRCGDSAAFMAANAAFRAAWIGLVSNQRLVRAIELYADHVRHVRVLTLDDPRVRAIVIRGMQRIVAALAAGDGDGAAAAMQAQLVEAQKALRKAVGLNGQ